MSEERGEDRARADRLAEILGRAIDLPTEEQEALVLAEADDEAQASEILAILAIETRGDFLDRPAFDLVQGEETLVEGPVDVRDFSPGGRGPGDRKAGGAPSAPFTPVRTRVGPYRLEEKLGGGGMGVVYRGFDERLQRPVALKQIRSRVANPQTERRFRREAKAVAKIDHPSIVRVHDWLQEDDGDWLVMELIEGRHLGQILEAHGPREPEQVTAWASQIAGALAAAHDAGILHRDLKPENVMISAGGALKLLDFGLAKPLDQGNSFAGSLDEPLTAEGNILGTVSAMSPEQALGEPLDERSDLFSLGSLMYRLLSGKPPFRGDLPMITMQAIAFEDPPPLEFQRPGLPPALVRLIERLMAKDRAERPRNARQVQAQLAELARLEAASKRAEQSESGEIDTSQKSIRRPVTVLVIGLSSHAASDPEALLDLMPRLDEIVLDVIERWGGRLEGRMGDSWIACFGVPRAREDDARRAIHAALEVEREAGSFSGEAPLRLGVHSGTAIITASGGREELALGPTYDSAVAAQGPGDPGVFISAETHVRAGRFFNAQVDADAAEAGRFRVEGVDDLNELQSGEMRPLFGRARELESLQQAYRAAREGLGKVMLISGEPGIGKSSLLGQFRIGLRQETSAPGWLELHGSSVRRSSPFQQVVLHLRRLLDVRLEQPAEEQLGALERLCHRLELPEEEIVPYLAPLLGLNSPRFPSQDLDPRLRKRRIQEALATLWTEMAELRPLVMVVEDAQWLDPSSLEVLTLLIDQVPTVPMLLIATHRVEFTPPWGARGHVAEIRLERLAKEAVREHVEAISKLPLPDALVQRIADKADGVPLYIQELTRAVLESDQLVEEAGSLRLTGPLDKLVIPASLEESLASRLDRLGSAREVAQLASVIGREFPRDLLMQISDPIDGDLDLELEKLVEEDLVYRKGFGRRARFLFRHSLIQDAAYASLLRRRRRILHRRVADALAKTRLVPPPPELLAHHLSEAGDWSEAIGHWQTAGSAAILASAHSEAESHARKALAGLPKLRDLALRERTELTLLTLLGRSVAGLRGYSSEEVHDAYDRAAELCERIDDDQLVTQVNWGLWAFYIVRSEISRALDHGRQLLRLAERSDSTSDWLVAHSSMSVAHYFGGDLEAARAHAESALEYEAANPDRQRTTASPQDLGVNALMSLALIDWHHGRSSSAVAWSEKALKLAEDFRHPYSQVFAGSWSARLHQSRRDGSETARLAEDVVKISERHGFFWATQGWFFKGCAAAQEARDRQLAGDLEAEIPAEAVAAMHKGLAAYRATGARLSVSYMQAQLAEVHLWRGDLEAAVEALTEAEHAAQDGREGYWRPELRRIAAEIAGAKRGGKVDDGTAEDRFLEARGLAQAAGDRALALRASLGLAEHWRSVGRGEEAARALEEELRDWRAENQDRGDLAAARRLLSALATTRDIHGPFDSTSPNRE
ncbi:MAG: protein kinase [Acidobacteriota bacterium]